MSCWPPSDPTPPPLPRHPHAQVTSQRRPESGSAGSVRPGRGHPQPGRGWCPVEAPLATYRAGAHQIGGLFPLLAANGVPAVGARIGYDSPVRVGILLPPGGVVLRMMLFGARVLISGEVKGEFSDTRPAGGSHCSRIPTSLVDAGGSLARGELHYSCLTGTPKKVARWVIDEQARKGMAEIVELADAVAELVQDGDEVAMEGFTHLIPFAAGREVIRQARGDLTLVRMTPDLIYDQLIGAGCAAKLVFSWGGNPGVGSLHRFRDAVQRNWPRALEIEEHSHAGMATRYVAGASGLPFGLLRGYFGTDLPTHTDTIRSITCPFTGEQLAAVPALNPEVAIIHAQRADRDGNVQLWGIIGIQKEAVLSASRCLVSVEEIVDELTPVPGAVVLPGWVVTAVAVVPRGAAPSYAHGYYDRDNAAYQEWDAISRDRQAFTNWLLEVRQ